MGYRLRKNGVSIIEEWVINNQKDCQNFMFSVISYRLFTVAHSDYKVTVTWVPSVHIFRDYTVCNLT